MREWSIVKTQQEESSYFDKTYKKKEFTSLSYKMARLLLRIKASEVDFQILFKREKKLWRTMK